MQSAVPNRSRLLFALLYLGEGGPIGFIWWALPTWLRLQGLEVDKVTTLTGLLVLPWVCKFLWAPLVDRATGKRFGLRAWIVSSQVLMGATLLPLVFLDLAQHFGAVTALLFAHSLSAATQDVSVDALALRMVQDAERGRVNGAMQAGMLVGRSLFGGGALLLSSHLGWPVVILALVLCIWTSTAAVLFLRLPAQNELPCCSAFWPPSRMSVLKRPSTWLGLSFALTAGAAFEATGILCGPMLVDRGIDQGSVGWLLGVPIVAATITGGLLGGWLADKFGHGRSVIAGILGFSGMVLVIATLNLSPDTTLLFFAFALTAFYLCIGLFTASSYALFMDLSRPPLAATQFSAFMAATNGCEAWAATAGGRLVSASGYSMAFVVMTVVSVLAIPLVWLIAKPSTQKGDRQRDPTAPI